MQKGKKRKDEFGLCNGKGCKKKERKKERQKERRRKKYKKKNRQN
jgi:hypothetical protein